MAQALPRASFNSAGLVRLLADLELADGADPPVAGTKQSVRQSVAERLSLWLDWTDAVALSDALTGAQATPVQDAATTVASPAAVLDELARLRATLTRAIQNDELLSAPTARPAATPLPATDHGDPTDFATYRRCCLDHQRSMAAGITPLRARVRAALAGRSAALGQLAALDAVMDKALAAREHHLMSTVPLLLEKHFKRLGQAAGGTAWLPGYCRDMQAVLLAELALRLQPIDGLVDTLQTDTPRQA